MEEFNNFPPNNIERVPSWLNSFYDRYNNLEVRVKNLENDILRRIVQLERKLNIIEKEKQNVRRS